MRPRMCAAVAGPVFLCSLVSSNSAGAQVAQAGTVTAAISGIVAVPTGALIGNRGVSGGGAIAFRYAPTALSDVAMRVELSGLWPSSRDNNPPDQSTVTANGSSTLSLLAGPELERAALGGHFYATVTAGAAHIWATSSASSLPTPAYGPFNTTTGRQATNLRVEWWRRVHDAAIEHGCRGHFRGAVLRSRASDVCHDDSKPDVLP